VDVRQDQRYLAEQDLFPCGDRYESRFSPDFAIPLTSLELQVSIDPSMPREISRIEVLDGCKSLLEGPERQVISDLMELIKAHDSDLILCPHADTWIPLIVRKASRYGLEPTISRTGFFKPMASKSYWSYGKVNHKEGAMIPEGLILIDTAKSFVYAESGLKGVLMASRLSGLSPNLTSRFTPGTLISSYEVFEALRRGVAVSKEGCRGLEEHHRAEGLRQGRHDVPAGARSLRESAPDRLHISVPFDYLRYNLLIFCKRDMHEVLWDIRANNRPEFWIAAFLQIKSQLALYLDVCRSCI